MKQFKVDLIDENGSIKSTVVIAAANSNHAAHQLVMLGHRVGRCSEVYPEREIPDPQTDASGFAVHSADLSKSPATAALLNFLFWGAGYMYLGKSWGGLVLLVYAVLCLSWIVGAATLSGGIEDVSYSLFSIAASLAYYPVGVAFGWHAYMTARERKLQSR